MAESFFIVPLRGFFSKSALEGNAFELFSSMLDLIKNEVIRTVMTVRIQTREEVEAAEAAMAAQATQLENLNFQHADFNPAAAPEELLNPNPVGRDGAEAVSAEDHSTYMGVKVGRNDPCPCGSGKKFKQCHGKLA